MAGSSVTLTETIVGRMQLIKAAWVSDDTDGHATSAATANQYNGKVVLLTTVPSGSAAPTDNYDIAVTDSNSVDVLAGAGANRDTANTEQVVSASLGAVVGSALTIAVTNAGNTKQGTIYIVIQG